MRRSDELEAAKPTSPSSFDTTRSLAAHVPHFPSLAELARVEPEKPKKRREQGLFEGLLQSRPEPILQVVEDVPGRFDPAAVAVLYRLYEDPHILEDLSPTEQRLLDEATAEFFAARPRGAKKPEKATPQRLTFDDAATDGVYEDFVQGPGLNPYWWT